MRVDGFYLSVDSRRKLFEQLAKSSRNQAITIQSGFIVLVEWADNSEGGSNTMLDQHVPSASIREMEWRTRLPGEQNASLDHNKDRWPAALRQGSILYMASDRPFFHNAFRQKVSLSKSSNNPYGNLPLFSVGISLFCKMGQKKFLRTNLFRRTIGSSLFHRGCIDLDLIHQRRYNSASLLTFQV